MIKRHYGKLWSERFRRFIKGGEFDKSILTDKSTLDPRGRFIRFLRKHLRATGGEYRVLSLGSGPGAVEEAALRYLPGARMHTVDFAENLRPLPYAQAERGHEDRAERPDHRHVRADMTQLPFKKGRFDRVMSSFAIDIIGRDALGIATREAGRVLKDGGKMVLLLHRIGTDREKLKASIKSDIAGNNKRLDELRQSINSLGTRSAGFKDRLSKINSEVERVKLEQERNLIRLRLIQNVFDNGEQVREYFERMGFKAEVVEELEEKERLAFGIVLTRKK